MRCSKPWRRIAELLLSALLLWPLIATAEEEKAPPLYQVEVIVFTTGALAGWTEEFWPWPPELKALLTPPQAETASDPMQNDSATEGEKTDLAKSGETPPLQPDTATPETPDENAATTVETAEDIPYEPDTPLLDELLSGTLPPGAPAWMRQIRTVPPSQYLLSDALEKLTPRKGYRVVLHRAWIQPAIPARQSHFIALEGANAFGDSALLRIRFHLNRYAHVNLNLDVTRTIPTAVREAFAAHEGVPLEQLPDEWSFHQTAHRKLKSKEWHYIDHPLFGTLVVINRIRARQ